MGKRDIVWVGSIMWVADPRGARSVKYVIFVFVRGRLQADEKKISEYRVVWRGERDPNKTRICIASTGEEISEEQKQAKTDHHESHESKKCHTG